MNAPWTAWFAWLAAACAASAAATGPEAQARRLIAQARAAATLDQAERALAQAKQLIRRAKLPRRERAFLAADAQRARGRILAAEWRRRPKNADLRQRAQKALQAALAAYEKLQAECEREADRLEAKLGDAAAGDARYRAACGDISRTNYAMAWTEYGLGLVAEDDAERARHFKNAVRRFVSFTADGYRNHPIVIDCFLGQALALEQLGRYHEAAELLTPADRDNTPPRTYAAMQLCRLRCLQAQGSHLKAEAAAKAYFDSLPAGRRLNAAELEMAVLRAQSLAQLLKTHAAPRYRERFRRRLGEVMELVRPYGAAWAERVAKAMGGVAAQGAFAHLLKTRKLFDAGQYEAALREAEQGLAAAGPGDAAFLPDLRYAKTAAAWNLGRWLDAFRSGAEFLRLHPNDRRARRIAEIATQAGLKARAAKPPLPDSEFLLFLDLLQRALPDCPEARKAPWYRADVWLHQGRYEEAAAALAKVGPKSPIYHYALYGRALAAYKQAEAFAKERNDVAASAARHFLSETFRLVRRFADAAAKGLPPDERPLTGAMADIAAAAGWLWLDLPHTEPAALVDMLRRAQALPHAGEKTARQLRALFVAALALSGRVEEAARRLDDVMKNGAADPYAANALIAVADPLEREYQRRLKGSDPGSAKRLAEQLVQVYAALLAHVSAAQGEHEAQEVAIRRRLAHSLLRAGRYKEAISHYEWLRARVPLAKAGDVLHGLAVALQRTGEWARAADVWRVLAQGLQPKTTDWYEAQHSLIRCLLKAGKTDAARKRLQYFKLLYPKIADAAWRAKFAALERELGS